MSLKLTETTVLGISLFSGYCVRGGLKWAQNDVFQLLSKVSRWSFCIFLHKVTAAQRLQINKMVFS